MAEYDPFGVNGGSGGTTTVAKSYKGSATANNAGKIYDPFNMASLPAPNSSPKSQQKQQAKPAPKPQQSLFNKVVSAVKSAPKEAISATKAVAKPVADVVTGQGGKAVHDTAQLTSDVSGGTANQFARAVAAVPPAVRREIQNKPITDIQQHAFGTTNPADIAKKIVASTAGTGSLLASGGEVAGAKTLLAKGATVAAKQVGKDAAIGAVGNASATVGSNPKASLKEVGKSAAIGGLLGAAAPHVIKVAGDVTRAAGEKVADTKAGSIIDATTSKSAPAKELIQNQKTQTLLHYEPKNPKVQQLIADREKQAQSIAAPAKAAEAEQASVAKETENNQAQGQKIDRQVQLIQAKKADNAGELSNVDQTKLQHLQEDKQKLGTTEAPAVEKVPGATPVAPVSTGSKVISDIKPVSTAEPAKLETPQPKENIQSNEVPQTQKPSVAQPASVSEPATTKAVVDPNAPPEQGTSAIAKDIQTKAVAKNLSDNYGEVAQYSKINVANEAKKAVDFVNGDKDTLDKVISGEKPLPQGLRATAVIKAVEEHPEFSKDGSMLKALAKSPLNSESSRSAQELRLAAERDKFSATNNIKQLQQTKEEVAEKRLGKPVKKAVSDEVKAIRQAVPKAKVDKETFASFVDSLKC